MDGTYLKTTKYSIKVYIFLVHEGASIARLLKHVFINQVHDLIDKNVPPNYVDTVQKVTLNNKTCFLAPTTGDEVLRIIKFLSCNSSLVLILASLIKIIVEILFITVYNV